MSRPAGGGVPCPACGGGASTVPETRKRGGRVRRVRRCAACGHRWATVEIGADEERRYMHLARAMRRARALLGAALNEPAEGDEAAL